MAITVRCPNGHVLEVKDECAGKSGLCPKCKALIKVPVPSSKDISEDDIMGIMETSAPAKPSSKDVMGDDSDDMGPGRGSGLNLTGSSIQRRKKVCPTCSNNVSYAFTTCPRCGTPLTNAKLTLPE
jgi:hypothetical protein